MAVTAINIAFIALQGGATVSGWHESYRNPIGHFDRCASLEMAVMFQRVADPQPVPRGSH